jgi:hypothetical protein
MPEVLQDYVVSKEFLEAVSPDFWHYYSVEGSKSDVTSLYAEVLDDPNGNTWYMLVEDRDVDPAITRAARMGRDFASAHLGVTAPPLAFFRPEGKEGANYRRQYGRADWPAYRGEGNRLGHAGFGSIAVNADVPPLLAIEIAAHEVFHVARAGRPERDARDYGAYASGVLTAGGSVARVFVDGDDLASAAAWDVRVSGSGTVLWNLDWGWCSPYVTCPVNAV